MQTVNGKNILISKDGEEVQEIVRAYGRIIWLASGVAGQSATIDSVLAVTLPAGSEATAENIGTNQNARLVFGIPEGNGIASIEKTGSTDNVDHYRIHYTNGGHFDYDVTNGGGGSGASVWGQITGTLSDQTDLQDALNAKADTADLGTMSSVNDAPSDDKTYGRKNGEWAEVTGGSGGSSEWGQITGTLSDQTDLQDALDNKADVIVNSASGSIVSIPDAKASPVVGLSVGIEPVQDLHGQTNPYPAGGGKNLFDGVSYNTFIPLSATSGEKLLLQADFTNGGGYLVLRAYDSEQTFLQSTTSSSGSGNVKYGIITLASDCAYVRIEDVSATGTVTNVMLEKGVSVPSAYAPYENVCPISGHTSATVTRTGRNLFDEEWELGSISTSTGENTPANDCVRTKNLIAIPPSSEFTISRSDSTSFYALMMAYHADGSFSRYVGALSSTPIHKTLNADEAFIRFFLYGRTQPFTNAMLELGSTATAYEPYQGQQVTIDLDGTRYGGRVDFLTGTMTVDSVMQNLVGDAVYDAWYSQDESKDSIGFYKSAIGWSGTGYPMPVSGDGQKFDYCKVGSVYNQTTPWVAEFLFISGSFNRFEIRIPKANLADVSTSAKAIQSAQAYLEAHPLQAVYKIEPVTVTLTPATLNLLYGNNTLWADTGDISVDYKADTKLYIEALKAQLQALILQN